MAVEFHCQPDEIFVPFTMKQDLAAFALLVDRTTEIQQEPKVAYRCGEKALVQVSYRHYAVCSLGIP